VAVSWTEGLGAHRDSERKANVARRSDGIDCRRNARKQCPEEWESVGRELENRESATCKILLVPEILVCGDEHIENALKPCQQSAVDCAREPLLLDSRDSVVRKDALKWSGQVLVQDDPHEPGLGLAEETPLRRPDARMGTCRETRRGNSHHPSNREASELEPVSRETREYHP